MMNKYCRTSKSCLAIFHISSSIINSGDAVGRYTGIKLFLFSLKYASTFFDL